MRTFAVIFFRLGGWEIKGTFPKGVTKSVVVAAPHTTGFDLPYMLLLAFHLRLRVYWMGKNSLFFFPFKHILLWLGGIPIDRNASRGIVPYCSSVLRNAHDEIHLVIAPSGTRKNVRVNKWKFGFYHIAVSASVPIILAYLDYKNKKGGFEKVFFPSGNFDEDIVEIADFYEQFMQ